LVHEGHDVPIVRTVRLVPVLGCVLAGSAFMAAPASTRESSPGKPAILGYPYGRQCPAAGYAERVDRWLMDTCNCTSYVAWALAANGRRIDWFRAGQMDAHNWPSVAREASISVGRSPGVDAVAVWPRLSPPWGHVAFVTAVHPDGTFDVAEYNLLHRFRFDARYRVSPAGATFVYVPLRDAG
jgi:surface antigen